KEIEYPRTRRCVKTSVQSMDKASTLNTNTRFLEARRQWRVTYKTKLYENSSKMKVCPNKRG
ncbi:hypothetical protein, partial [Effusibacillus consociatus]